MRLTTRKLPGFSLIELLVVLTVIGLLLSFVAPMVLDRPNQARQLKVANDLQAIKAALSLYYVDNGVLPTDGQGLQPLLGTENGFRYLEDMPIDPWGNDYQYRVRGTGQAIIISIGPDGKIGGDDDRQIEIRK